MASRRPNDPPPRKPDIRQPEIPKVIKSDEKVSAAAASKAAPAASPQRARKPTGNPAGNPVRVADDIRRAMIAEAAYLRAERRDFATGNEEEDWLAAEAEVDALLQARHGGTSQ
ncbi:MAG TPA: DUF2934 domain-containing protein [Steroidobacteraceae bacterium]